MSENPESSASQPTPADRFQGARCDVCRYELTGLRDGVCPECGRPVYRFTDRARAVMLEANRHAIELLEGRSSDQPSHAWWKPTGPLPESICPFHLLMGMTTGSKGVGLFALEQTGIDVYAFRHALGRGSPTGDVVSISPGAVLPLDSLTHKLVKAAIEDAHSLGHDWVGTEHLLLAALASSDRVVRAAAKKCGLNAKRIRAVIIENNKNHGSQS